jgi:hypothetical protein
VLLTIGLIFLLFAFICFILASFKVAALVDFWPLGWAFVVLAFIFGAHF